MALLLVASNFEEVKAREERQQDKGHKKDQVLTL